MTISDFTQGRDNNFNLIRIVAALAVLTSHSFALAIGTGDAEPFQESLGMSIGTIAVDIFFITSGFLVTSSLLTKQSIAEFIWARILRVYPALLIMLLLTVFGFGSFFTSLPLPSYFTNSKTYFYFLKCATLITGIAFDLPGVFESNPFKNWVNGSLWTLPCEIQMYALLALIWVSLRVINRSKLKLFQRSIVTIFFVASILVVVCHFYLHESVFRTKYFFMFFTGAVFYVLKEHISLSRSFFWLFVIALLSSAIFNKHAFFVVYLLTIGYILFYIAYIPSGYIRKYNQAGDYSYGIYIYAYPVQQSVAALIPGVSVLSVISISAPATLLLAVLSWHLLERRALGLKGLYVSHTRRILSYGLTDASIRKL
jgi:peptidoglycan/LPS O-acetylase OafA/YrhL